MNKIIHVGYKLLIDDIAKENLKKYLEEETDKLRSDPYTAVLFKDEQTTMNIWYNKKINKEIYGFIHGLYIDKKKGVVVAEIFIDASNYYLTLVHCKINVPLNTLKLMANRGDFGEKIIIEPRIKILCSAYKQF